MLIDMDSKPKDTIFYIAIQLHNVFQEKENIKITDLNSVFNKIDANHPEYKYNLALNLLYLLNKVQITNKEVHYVSD